VTQQGTLEYRKRFIRSDQATQESTRLEYNVSIAKDAVFILDDHSEIISAVACSSSWLNVSFALTAEIPPKLLNAESLLVHGSSSWGCQNMHGNEGDVFKRIKGTFVHYKTSANQVMAFLADDCSPLNFFGKASVSFFTNHSMIDKDQLRRMLGDGSTIDRTKSARENLRVNFPSTGDALGYGARFDLLNWNYDSTQDGAVESSIPVLAHSFGQQKNQ
jgi:hypothetical protein